MTPPTVIEVEGVLYPSTPIDACPGTVRDACEEFTPDELDELASGVVGIPVWVEHDASKVVGTVKRARRTASNAVWVTFQITGNDDTAVDAIKGVRNGSLCGISLSHDFSYRRSAANRGVECSLGSVPLSGDIKHKGPIELSLCASPARVGCNVHEVRCAHTGDDLVGQVDASESAQKMQLTYLTGVVCASGMDTSPPPVTNPDMPPAIDPPAASAPAAPPTVDVDSAPSSAPLAPASAAPAEPVADEPTGTDDASVAPESVVPVAVPPPAGAEYIDAMNRATKMIQASARTAQEAQSAAEQLKRDNAELYAAKKKFEDELQREKKLTEQRAREHAKQIQDAENDRHLQTLRCLQDTLSACAGGAGIGTDLSTIVHTDPAEQQRRIANTAVDLAAQADVAIKGMTQSSRHRAEEADMHARGEKRAREEAAVARTQLHDVAYDLQRFGGMGNLRPETGIRGGVRKHASPPDETPLAKMARSDDPAAAMRDFQAANPKATWSAYCGHYNSLVGAVSASAQHGPPTPLCAHQLHPGLFETMSSMNRGRTPSSDETRKIIDGMNVSRSVPFGPPR